MTEDHDKVYIRYKCSDCCWLFSEDEEIDELECPECGSHDVTAINNFS